MEYISFERVVDFCKEKNFYLGLGNPDAKILIVGKEIGYGHKESKNPSLSEIIKDSEKQANCNLLEWQKIIRKEKSLKKHLDERQSFFKDKHNRMPTWKSYQEIVSGILGVDNFFLNHSFITEYSQLSLPKSRYQPEEKKEFAKKKKDSINNRKSLFDLDFFKNFPVVIMACGSYTTKEFVESVFSVNFESKTELSKGFSYSLYKGEDKILIHTRQLSNFFGSAEKRCSLIQKIVELCKSICETYVLQQKI